MNDGYALHKLAIWLTFIAFVVLIGMWIGWAFYNTHAQSVVKRDQIAACVTSDDVVGCLQAANGLVRK